MAAITSFIKKKKFINNSIVSKLSLGTAQFGQDYGIANTTGKIAGPEVFEILNYAQSVGIQGIDTAAAYGDSELVLGAYLREKPNRRFKIVSKFFFLEPSDSGKVEQFLEQSLKRLEVKQLYGYLLHRFDDILINSGQWNHVIRLKERALVQKIGFSLYSPEELVFLLDKEIKFDMVQVPYSIFDRRFEKYFDLLKKKGIEIHARSIFLQGLAFLDLKNLPASLERARPQLDRLRQIAENHKISVEALCLNFVLLNSHIDQVIIGVDSLAQLKDNVAGIDSMAAVTGVYGQLSGIKIDCNDILLPYKWAISS